MTSTPVLVGAGDTLRHSGMESRQLSLALDNLSLGYALTYLIGLVSLIVGARYLPKLQHQDLQTSAQQIARERGLDTDANRKVYLLGDPRLSRRPGAGGLDRRQKSA